MNDYTYEEIEIGQVESFSKEMTREMEILFGEISGDVNPLHVDDDFAQDISRGKFKSHVTYGMLTASLYSTIAGVYLPGKYSLIHSFDKISFKKPVYVGDVLTVTGTVTDKQDDFKLIYLFVKVTNQHNQTVSEANMKVLVQK